MTPEEFRAAGHLLIDWIADSRASVEDQPVLAQVEPGDVRARFETDAPTDTSSFEALLAELDTTVIPGVTQVQHPMHFGWFPSNASLSSVLGDIASSGIGSLGISWESSPALTEVEEVMCDWMRQLTGLSDAWLGSIHDTASTACLVALLVARERATDLVQNTGGLQSVDEPLMIYTSPQAHSSVAKAALLAGFGWDNIRMIDVDSDTFAMNAAALKAAMDVDAAEGKIPAAVVAAVGTTGTTAMDPVRSIVEAAASHGAFVHVDAAMAGTAMLLPECRHLWDGIEGADSISWNPHKWMGTILDCSLLYMRDVDLLQRIMATNPSYLQSPSGDDATQFRDWGIPLGRRFRSLKLLFQLRLDGIDAIRARLRRDLENAQWFKAQVEATDGWTVVAPVDLQTVCVRYQPEGFIDGHELDAFTQSWARSINASGDAFLSPSKLPDGWMVRVSIGVLGTERHHVERLWTLMQETVQQG